MHDSQIWFRHEVQAGGVVDPLPELSVMKPNEPKFALPTSANGLRWTFELGFRGRQSQGELAVSSGRVPPKIVRDRGSLVMECYATDVRIIRK